MVYRGKPSAACGACRKRRSRCDQVVPACGQCTKAGRLCPGYRNAMDLMFHDESTRIVTRHQGRISTSGPVGPNVDAEYSAQQKAQAAIMPPIRLTDFVLYQPIDDLGLHFFMSNYVGDNPAVSQLYYLPQLYSQKGLSSPELRQSIKAAGLAGYAKSVRRKEMLVIATKAYVGAIRDINTALSHPTNAAQDATLAAIILAAMYEMMIAPKQTGMKNCSKHLAGAVTVAVLVAKRKQQSDVTQKLLSTLVQSVIINSWVQHEPLPAGFDELSQHIEGLHYTNSAHGRFLDLLVHLVKFRHDLAAGLYETPMSIITKSLSIDYDLLTFMDNMPPEARYQEHQLTTDESHQLAFDGYYHVYPYRFTAHLWNNARGSRLRLHQVILRQLQILRSSSQTYDPNTFDVQKIRSEHEITIIAKDILATVPQLAGYMELLDPFRPACVLKADTVEIIPHQKSQSDQPKPGPKKSSTARDPAPVTQTPTPANTPSPQSPQSSPEADATVDSLPYTPITAPQYSSLYHILFNLYALRSVTCLPSPMKAWILDRITWMENTADSQDITRLKEMMRTRPGDGFPVGADEGYVMLSYDFNKALQRPAPLLVSYD